MKTQKMKISISLIVLFAIGLVTANAQDIPDPKIARKAQETIDNFNARNWQMQTIMDEAYGYAVFPSIGKGGFGIGGALGKGILYENGIAIGEVKMTQVSVGFQWGGQAYSEIIFFEDKDALDLFKSNKLELAAQASAVAVTEGVSADVPYNNGVAIYTLPKAGLMYEATVGGQKFKYKEENASSTD
jgi:lipid-binding SYLF domain-containing protein